jgi:hypothetical protein
MKFHNGKTGLYLIILTFTALSFFSLIWDPDFFWHLATGRWIFEHRAIPVTDPFGVYDESVTGRSQIILRGYWLCQLLYYLVYASFGYIGFAALKAAAFALLFTGQFRLLAKKGICTGIIATQSLVVYAALLDFRSDRPQLFSYVGIVAVLLLLELKLYRWLPLVMIVWANLHGGFLLGVVIIAMYAGIELLRRLREGKTPLQLFPWGVAAIVSAGINPNFFTAFKEVVSVQGSEYQKTVIEYMPPLTVALKYNDIYWLYFLVLLAGSVLALLLRKRITAEQIAVFVSLAGLSLTASRYIPFLIIAGSLYIAIWLSPLLQEGRKSTALALVSLVLMGMICAFDLKDGRGLSHGIVKGRFPEEALQYLASTRISGDIFCNDYWGGYVLWRLPGHRVSCDTRAISTGRVMENLALLTDEKLFAGLADSNYRIILTTPLNQVSGERYLLWQYLTNSPAWRLVYADDISLLFVRSDERLPGISNPAARALDTALNQATSFTVQFPDTAFHWVNLAEIHLLRREPQLAAQALRTALAKKPGDPEISNRLLLLERGIY